EPTEPVVIAIDEETPLSSPSPQPTDFVNLSLDQEIVQKERQRFNPQAKLDVVFVDASKDSEGAIDEDSPTREFLRLLMRAIHQANVFQGPEKDGSLALDTQAQVTDPRKAPPPLKSAPQSSSSTRGVPSAPVNTREKSGNVRATVMAGQCSNGEVLSEPVNQSARVKFLEASELTLVQHGE
ncbi:hypothetical protein DNTS_027368, partial [Danionella cerebrum]